MRAKRLSLGKGQGSRPCPPLMEILVLQSFLSGTAVVQRLNYLEQSLCGPTLGEVFTVFKYIIFNEMFQPLPHLIK